jgi:glycine/D-amino acid oxidase-like deaminating enzyme
MNTPDINTFQPDRSVNNIFTPHPAFSPANHSVCVVGAGAFGGWTALALLRKGYKVSLFDAWGAGNSRSSSGDETRVIRSTYGNNELYFRLNARALELWKEHESIFGRKVFFNSGVLWFCYEESTPIVDDSIPFSVHYRMPYEYLSPAQLEKRYPEINAQDLHHAYLDPFGGYLKAREACEEVKTCFIQEGGQYSQTLVRPGKIENGRVTDIIEENGNRFQADVFIFACGAWLPKLFPEILEKHLHCTRQEVFYFGVPPENASVYDTMPAWIDADGRDFYYGIAGNASRGFKIGVDKRGDRFDPTSDDRTLNPDVLREARKFLTHRFPGLRDAPLLESRVCPYERSATGNFIFEQHPESVNLFFLGGGSGHGFKHGPALGELIAKIMCGEAETPDLFRISY